MNWQIGLILVIVVAVFVPWLVAEVIHFGSPDDEWDNVAERKRQIERRARKQSGEFQ